MMARMDPPPFVHCWPRLCENFELVLVEFPSRSRCAGASDAHSIRHKTKTEKRIFDELRPGTFSHSLGPRLPTWTTQRVGRYLRYTGHDAKVIATAARAPKPDIELTVNRLGLRVSVTSDARAAIASADLPQARVTAHVT